MNAPMTTADLRAMLRVRYPAAAFALVFEVRDAAGHSATRSCDALCLGTWPSRGLRLTGFELKCSRSDWLREYRKPEKADPMMRYCDEWYLVTGDATVAEIDEVPATWGLLVAERGGRRFRVVKAAPTLTPEPWSRSFVAAFLKRAQGQSLAAEERTGAAAAVEQARRWRNEQESTAERELATLRQKLANFEAASGIRIDSGWPGQNVGDAVRLLMRAGAENSQYALDQLDGAVRAMGHAVAAVREAYASLAHDGAPLATATPPMGAD